MESIELKGRYIAIIISEVKSSSRELYPLTKNYPMSLLPVGSKRLIVYQLESLLKVQSLLEVIIVTTSQQKALKHFIDSQFIPQHPEYPYKIKFFSVEDLSNTFAAVKEVISEIKDKCEGFLILHSDTIVGVSLRQAQLLHQSKKSDLTLLLKAKRELSEQQKKLPQGEVQTQIDNVLIGQNNEVLFIDMADEIQNNGVKLDPSVYQLVKKASFKRVVDSKVYFISAGIASLITGLSSQQIYQVKPWLIQLFVHNQTNKKLLSINNHLKDNDLKPLKIYAQFNQQDAFVKKINSKKIYECLNFDSLIRGAKQKEILLPTTYNDKSDQTYKGNACVADGVNFGPGGKMRRCIIGTGCKIGKNVQLLNSIILQNVQIKDNCKINESVIGANSYIGEGASIKATYGESGCRVADGVRVESDTLIKSE